MTSNGGWDKDASPHHAGERALHERYGRVERQELMGRRMIRPFMPDQHREFFEQLPFIILGSIDRDGAPWASVVFGLPGFVSAPTDKSLVMADAVIPGDPLAANLQPGAPVSFLGIEPPTRRRNRLNAIVAERKSGQISFEAVQSFGNCPQYIQMREMTYNRDPSAPSTAKIENFAGLDDDARRVIAKADTFFVASSNPNEDIRGAGGVDVNHRGGMAGFVEVDGDTLTIPDYSGNFAFNTLGNLLVNPHAGLLFIDFDSGDLLLLTGTT